MTDLQHDQKNDGTDEKGSVSPLNVVSSVLAAGLGIQNSKNRERDFKQGNFKVFVIAGIVFTLLFIGTVFTIVQMVLKGAGA